MSLNSTYRIDFHSLKTGESYLYDFPVDDRFFEHWPEGEVAHGNGEVHIRVVKHASMLELTVTIDATVMLTCDRCLDEFLCPVHFEGHPVVKISDTVPDGEHYSGDAHRETNNSDGEVLWITPAEESLDMGQYIYESIMLSLPFQRVHPNIKDCNPDMLQRFRIVSESEFDELTAHAAAADEDTQTQNPFAALANLKQNPEKDENK